MRIIRLSTALCQHLKRATYLPADLRELVDNRLPECGSINLVQLSPVVAERFRDAFTTQLARVGFDRQYALTPEGRLLEELIDKFAG